jgi:hypothetical protein
MNDRIRHLAKKSGLLGRKFMFGEYYYDELSDEQLEFAELIVFECTNAVMDGTKEGDHYAMRIEQHFDNGQGGILNFGAKE